MPTINTDEYFRLTPEEAEECGAYDYHQPLLQAPTHRPDNPRSPIGALVISIAAILLALSLALGNKHVSKKIVELTTTQEYVDELTRIQVNRQR